MKYVNELRKLKKLVNNDVWEMFKRHNVIIAGGAITSVFCNREVNDIDVYFRTPEDYLKFVHDIFQGEYQFRLVVTNVTNRSVLLVDRYTGQHVQLIVYKFFKNELQVFKDYDFTCNMGALSFNWAEPDTEHFVFHPDFLKHNSQRYLSFNEGTAYPLISALRVAKYVEKGYNISKAQMLKVLMAVNTVSLNSWEEVKDHCGGFYGLNLDEVFPVKEEFSIQKAMESLSNVFAEDVAYKNTYASKFYDLYLPVKKYFEEENNSKENTKGRWFKNVGVVSDKENIYFSHYKNSFHYKLGEFVNGGSQGIWVSDGSDVLNASYGSASYKSVILELEGDIFQAPAYGYHEKRLKGDVFVKAVYTKEEFMNKFDCEGIIPAYVTEMLENYEYGEEENTDEPDEFSPFK